MFSVSKPDFQAEALAAKASAARASAAKASAEKATALATAALGLGQARARVIDLSIGSGIGFFQRPAICF